MNEERRHINKIDGKIESIFFYALRFVIRNSSP